MKRATTKKKGKTPVALSKILPSFQAPDATSNSTFKQAAKLQTLFNSLTALPQVNVIDIVAIQAGISGGGAETTPFAELRGLGVLDTDSLNLFLKRASHGDLDSLSNVGKIFEMARAVGKDAWGNPNYSQVLYNLLVEQGVKLDIRDIPGLLLDSEFVRREAQKALAASFT